MQSWPAGDSHSLSSRRPVAMRPGNFTLPTRVDTIEALRASPNSPRMPRKPVSRRYVHPAKETGNIVRLRALVRLFRLSPSAIGRATGFSRCYVARLLSRKDDFRGSPEFFRTLEAKLHEVIAGRTAQYFTVPAVSVARARDVLEMAA
jgi:hypothetical protein